MSGPAATPPPPRRSPRATSRARGRDHEGNLPDIDSGGRHAPLPHVTRRGPMRRSLTLLCAAALAITSARYAPSTRRVDAPEAISAQQIVGGLNYPAAF